MIKIILSIIISTLLLINTASAVQEPVPKPAITPDSPFYNIKLWFEDIQEKLTFNEAKKLVLKQEHLQNRLDELRYEVANSHNENIEKVLQKFNIKRLEIETMFDGLTPKEKSEFIYGMVQKSMKNGECPDGVFCVSNNYSYNATSLGIRENSTEVLNRILNDPNTPEQARKGLQNAINNTMKNVLRIEANPQKQPMTKQENIDVDGNMVQGTYQINPEYLSILPFTNAVVLDPEENKLYSIIVENDKIIILDHVAIGTPQYYLYPTKEQVRSLESIAFHINNNGMSMRDKIQLLQLWYQIEKKEVK